MSMNKSLFIISIFTIVFVSVGVFVFPNIHDVSACPNKNTNTALNTPAIPSTNNVNTLSSPSSLSQLSSSLPV